MTVTGSRRPVIYNASLSRREVALLAGWERARRRWVTIDDIGELVGRAVAGKVASALVRKGALVRLKPGLYLLRPFRLLHRPTATSAPAALEVLLHEEPHYLGGLWACTQNGLTQQQYQSMLDAFVSRPHRGAAVAGVEVRFHLLPSDQLDDGVVEILVEGLPVRMSGPERTLVDLLERPRMAGGLVGAVALFGRALPRVDAGRVAELASRVARTSTCQRIGLLLERAGTPPALLRKLARRTRGSKSLLSLQPGPRTGPVSTRWSVVENDRGLGTPDQA